MTPIEWIAAILIVFAVVKILVLLVKPVAWMKFAKAIWSNAGVVKIVAFVLAGVVFVYLAIREFQKLWIYFSGFVGVAVGYFLSLIGTSTLYYVKGLPVLNFNGFSVGIAQTCSGIDSILLFTGLYLGILAWDWKLLNKGKIFGMYFVGVLGAFALNIIRIFLMILIGTYISEDFALHAFHTNASSLLFIIYFAIFWKLSYKWMLRR